MLPSLLLLPVLLLCLARAIGGIRQAKADGDFLGLLPLYYGMVVFFVLGVAANVAVIVLKSQ